VRSTLLLRGTNALTSAEIYFQVTSQPHAHATSGPAHPHPHADGVDADTRIKHLLWFIEAHFGDVEPLLISNGEARANEDDSEPALVVRLDGASAQVNLVSLVRCFSGPLAYTIHYGSKQAVTSADESLKKRIEVVLDTGVTTVSSLGQTFVSHASVGARNGVGSAVGNITGFEGGGLEVTSTSNLSW
jgi:cleavage and polyadenylation specificity factor subunit 3